MYKAKFRTAFLQREIPVDVAVVVDGNLEVGQLVTYVPATATAPAYIKAVSGNTAEAALGSATHFIAQSDMTMEYGHVPVENRDYGYKNTVAGTVLGPQFKGYQLGGASGADISVSNPAAGDLVYNLTDSKLYKYDTSGESPAWTSVDAEVVAGAQTKKVALYAIRENNDLAFDVIVYDAD